MTNGQRSQAWWMNGKLHRVDGPAVIHPDGYQEWWLNGQRHRVDGPAIIHPDGSKEWWLNGELHRDDGPAYPSRWVSSMVYKWQRNIRRRN